MSGAFYFAREVQEYKSQVGSKEKKDVKSLDTFRRHAECDSWDQHEHRWKARKAKLI